ncbi:unnamed protein product [Caenorhabditis angaria]|uniref:BTB domain-containing protein n=1 Tax=Caenorhabditis angaria TaxID=860376 RepID=A0A9P1IPL0_9PELO|nr:unnamed protein product [Caenorhabditis angaria]
MSISKCATKFQSVFNDISTWDGSLKYSEIFEVEGLKWAVGIEQNVVDKEKYLSVLLKIANMEEEKAAVCHVDAGFRIIDKRHNKRDILMNFERKQYNFQNIEEKLTLVLWKQIIQSQYDDCDRWYSHQYFPSNYIVNDSIVIETNLDFLYQNYSQNSGTSSDICVKIESVDLYLKKSDLFLSSEYFNNLFLKSENKIVQIDDIKLADFFNILLIIHPKIMPGFSKFAKFLELDDFAKYVELADRFNIDIVHSKIAIAMFSILENVPKTSASFDFPKFRLKCLKFADKYNYLDIMNLCLNSFESIEEIRDASKSKDFEILSPETKSRVLYRILEFA